ncbi:uncharacterized protein LOC111631106 [Centruroides sculpturatus]|uniref:uncharacterized protein LOC111631106 n=1 Tax=Centruroides sculpturatus TaxID=218467 RepID=UPI000C6ED2E9|nr:uncharacterized protein LOC111631106 [Centruroides sculpturatus]
MYFDSSEYPPLADPFGFKENEIRKIRHFLSIFHTVPQDTTNCRDIARPLLKLGYLLTIHPITVETSSTCEMIGLCPRPDVQFPLSSDHSSFLVKSMVLGINSQNTKSSTCLEMLPHQIGSHLNC